MMSVPLAQSQSQSRMLGQSGQGDKPLWRQGEQDSAPQQTAVALRLLDELLQGDRDDRERNRTLR